MAKILVIGIAGRMGTTIAECIEDTDGVELGGGTERAGSDLISQDVGKVIGSDNKGVLIVDDPAIALQSCDVAIDFTTPASSMVTLKSAAKTGKPVVVGTTGFSAEQKKRNCRACTKNSISGRAQYEYRSECFVQAGRRCSACSGR